MANEPRPGGHKTTAANTAKVARRRQHAAAEAAHGGTIPKGMENFRLPQRDVEELIADPKIDLVPLGTIIGGIEDFKVLRGAVCQLALTTSTEHAHALTDMSLVSRAGSVLVIDVYEIDRAGLFPEVAGDDADMDGGD